MNIENFMDEIFAEMELETAGGATSATSCAVPPTTPSPGECVRGIGSADCTQGSWYRPQRRDNVWKVARRTIRESGQSGKISLLAYVRQISRHPANKRYIGTSGLATRQFLPRWGGRRLREYVGRGGGYGLMFLPPFGPGLEKARCS